MLRPRAQAFSEVSSVPSHKRARTCKPCINTQALEQQLSQALSELRTARTAASSSQEKLQRMAQVRGRVDVCTGVWACAWVRACVLDC